MKTWAGGGAMAGPPSPAAPSEFQAPQAPGLSNTRYKHKKEKKKIVVESLWAVICSYF
jgi:hypothetical protein